MKKLHELLGQKLYKGDVGVEIECEGRGISPVAAGYWRTEADGSLRGSYPDQAAEFVMAGPVTIDKVGKALDQLIDSQADAEFNFSFRTSVHVHVNVQILTEPEMLAFLYTCLLLEEPLTNFCGDNRKGNRFCLRYSDAEGYDKTLEGLFIGGHRKILTLDGDRIRYAAINIHALKKYGSIEFRGMRGNMDKDVIQTWCETLVHIREYAKELGSPVAVYNKYIAMDSVQFIKEAIGKHVDSFMYVGEVHDVERSFSLTIDLPHMYKARVEEIQQVPIEVAKPVRLPRANQDELPAFDYPQMERVWLLTIIRYETWLHRDGREVVTDEEKLVVFLHLYKKTKEEHQ